MSDDDPGGEPRRRNDFLLAEYDHLVDLFKSADELGERRVTIFLTIATGVIGVLTAATARRPSPEAWSAALTAVLLFGSATQVRLAFRARTLHAYANAVAGVRRGLAAGDEKLRDWLFFPAHNAAKSTDHPSFWRFGELEVVVLLADVIVASSLVYALCRWRLSLRWAASIAGLLVLVGLGFAMSARGGAIGEANAGPYRGVDK